MDGGPEASPRGAAALDQRLRECRAGGGRALNLGYLEGGLPADFAALVLAAAPHVAELDLSSNHLAALPEALAELRGLRVLRLKYNALIDLPPVLAALPSLAVLDLAGNSIEALDNEELGALTALRELDLSGNALRTLPDAVATLPCLETLRLGGNMLEALPLAIGACPALLRLEVSGNRLTALPPSLAQLASLQRIDAKNNFLTRVPPCLGHLKQLKEFDLRYNRLNKSYAQAAEKGLARFLSFLRDDEEMERLQEIERNKPVGQQVRPCTVYKCKALTEDALRVLGAGGEGAEHFAWIRAGHAACIAEGKLVYVLGGAVLKDGCKSGDLLWLTTDRMEWRLQPTKGDKPGPREGHCMVLDAAQNRLVIFGGRKQNRRRCNDVHFLDLNTWTWFQPRTEGQQPSPRDQCSAVCHDGKMFIFGGRDSSSRLNELHVLDLESWCWLVPDLSGSAPSPRQGAALAVHDNKLWVHGGRSNFVLDDLYCLDLDSGEWNVVATEGRIQPARYGHAISHHDSVLYLFGGTDALGAVVPALYRLRRAGANKFEWVETELSLPPNKSRCCLFSDGQLTLAQVGHTALRTHLPAPDVAAGRVVWDVVQLVQLKDVQDKAVRPEDLVPRNAKLDRIQHCIQDVAPRLPPSFTSGTSREQQVLLRIAQFKEAWAQRQAVEEQGEAGVRPPPKSSGRLLEPPLSLKNECGVDKAVCTTLRPTRLPHTELHDLEGAVQFVAEFFKYEPLEDPAHPPTHLVSPWSLLEWQAGDSFDLATLLASLLLGAGYHACVAVGHVPERVASGDQSGEECPYLAPLGIPQQLPPAAADAKGVRPESGTPDAVRPSGGSSLAAGGQRGDVERLGAITEAEEGEAACAPGAGASRPATAAGSAWAAASAPEQAGAATVEAESGCSGGVAGGGGSTTSSEPAVAAEGSAPNSSPAGAAGAAAGQAGLGSSSEGRAEAAAAGGGSAGGVTGDAGGSESAEAGPAATQGGEAAVATQQQPAPEGPPRFIHAFVLVLPGGREVQQPIFIDPATGMQYAPATLPCEAISYAWSHQNFWANLQRAGDQLAPPGATDWSFANPNAWEALLPNAGGDLVDSQSVSTEFSSATTSYPRSTLSHVSLAPPELSSSGSAARLTPRATGAAAGSAAAAAAPGTLRSQRKSISLQVTARAGGTPRLASHPTAKEFDGSGSLSYLAPTSSLLVEEQGAGAALRAAPRSVGIASRLAGAPPGPEMPPSWVPALAISRERLDVRCPKGSKRALYRQCQREIFARFGECARWDGLVERYTLYEDVACTQVECTVELFDRRKDRLVRRDTHPARRLVRDCFGPGAVGGLKESSVVRGESRDLRFYSETRADGLLRRYENIGVSLEEYFVGRPDRVASRKAKYGPPDVTALGPLAGSAAQRRGSLMLNPALARRDAGREGADSRLGERKASVTAAGVTVTYPLASITHKFSRDPATPCDADAAKLQFDLEEGTIRVVCHYGEDEQGMGRLTRAVRVYGPSGEVLENSGAACPPSADWCGLEHRRLAAVRKSAEVAAHAAEDELAEIAAARARQEQSVQLVTGHYDASRTQVQDSEEPEPEGPEAQDYLAPFLPAITGTRDMTGAEAAAVYRKCVQALHTRAAERTLVLEARRSAEAAEIKRLEGKAATELHTLSAAEQQRLQAQLSDARFRLGVLERRAEDHRNMTAEKLAALEARLRADVRLVPAIKAGLV